MKVDILMASIAALPGLLVGIGAIMGAMHKGHGRILRRIERLERVGESIRSAAEERIANLEGHVGTHIPAIMVGMERRLGKIEMELRRLVVVDQDDDDAVTPPRGGAVGGHN